MKTIIFGGMLLLLLLAPAWGMPEPQQQVEEMVNSVLSVLQKPDLTAAEKRTQVSGMVQKYLNMSSMARRTLGEYWNSASEEQRKKFTDLFVKVLEGTYLNRINDYSGGTVQYLKQRVKGDKAIIDTKFVSADLEIPVQYKMIFENGSWEVFDVVIDGVSLIRNYRSSYGEIIRKDGYEGLFALMEKKVSDMQPTEQPLAPQLNQ